MQNLTLAVEEEVLVEARKIAVADGTSVNRLVREYLRDFVKRRVTRTAAAERLKRSMTNLPIEIGAKTWTRDELHER